MEPIVVDIGTLRIEHAEPVKVELSRSQKGSYGWTITVHTVTPGESIKQLSEIDGKLKEKFGGENAGS